MKNKRSVLYNLNVIFFAFMFKSLSLSSKSILFRSTFATIFLSCQIISTSMAQQPTSKSGFSTKDRSLITSPDGFPPSLYFQSSITSPKHYNTKAPEALGAPVENLIVDAGTDVRLNCTGKHPISSKSSIAWIRHRSNESASKGMNEPFRTNETDGSILLQNIDPLLDNNSIFTCIVDNIKTKVLRLQVKSTPLAVINLSVIPHSVYALVRWRMPKGGDMGNPILRYELLYRLNKTHVSLVNKNSSSPANNNDDTNMPESESIQLVSDWNPSAPSEEEYEWQGNELMGNKIMELELYHFLSNYISKLLIHFQVVDDNISPNATSKVVYNLRPNSTYLFRIFAVNKLGYGENESVSTVTKYSIEEINEAITLLSEKGMASLYLK